MFLLSYASNLTIDEETTSSIVGLCELLKCILISIAIVELGKLLIKYILGALAGCLLNGDARVIEEKMSKIEQLIDQNISIDQINQEYLQIHQQMSNIFVGQPHGEEPNLDELFQMMNGVCKFETDSIDQISCRTSEYIYFDSLYQNQNHMMILISRYLKIRHIVEKNIKRPLNNLK